MHLETTLGIVAGGLGVAMGASPLLQAIRAHQRKSAIDVSLPFLGVLLAGALAWLLYGISLGNLSLIIANSVGVICSSVALAVTVWWRRHHMPRSIESSE